MNYTTVNKGFTLVEIMIVVVIIGLLAAMAIPAFNKVRETSQTKTITNNIRQIASASDQYFIKEGLTQAVTSDLIGSDSYMKSLPIAVAGEAYTTLFPVTMGFIPLFQFRKAMGHSLFSTNRLD